MKTFGWKSFLVGGLFVLTQAVGAMPAHAAPSLCNGPANGILDGDEQCETGPCCTSKCELKTADTVCRASTDAVCDPAETCGEQTAALDAACPADTFADEGTSCDDGSFCTATDACAAGACVGSGSPCDDDDSCTSDSCDEKKNSCSHDAAADGTSCDDGLACTTDDACSAGECTGTAVVCDDGNACTDDACSEETGACASTNNTASCDDGNFCTSDDVCAGGVCTGGGATTCDDGDACTTDSCDENTDSCTHGAAADGTSCDDGQFCTANDTCAAGVCTGGGATDCDDQNDCTADSCMESSDSCRHTKAANGASCEDGSACTADDTCSNGVCVGGTATVCNDDNLCTNDSCDAASGGCVFEPNTIPCNDGFFCTTGDRCGGGVCVGGTAPNCDDGNLCTTDSCDEETDSCSATPVENNLPCDDGFLCSIQDSCQDGKCVGGAINPCDDEIQCTQDSCNIGLDECKHTPMNNNEPCEDGSFCTINDSCRVGQCIGDARPCDDANLCTTDSCNEITDQCDNANNTLPCDDGQFCTTGDTCGNGTCSVSTPTCNDSNVCTTDSCDEAADTCSNVNNTDPCDDGLFCTTADTCAAGACVGGPARDCGDNNVCTNDSCNETTDVCDNVNNTIACDDSLFCTVNDTCANGACNGTARDCADTNLCTTDTCNEATDVCDNLNNTVPCDDGLFCTKGDACAGGVCVGGPATTCDDANACTTDTCAEETDSCSSVNNTAPCDDGLFCTNGDVCSNGACVAGPARDCGDANPCTTDACNETSNACENLANTLPCDDGLFCTTSDACSGGSCTGTARSCDDSDACTTDTCNEAGDACSNVAIPGCGVTTTTEECLVCGNFFDDDCVLTASDALGVLQSAVGLHECSLTVCDFSGDGHITALDALAVLRAAVDLPSNPSCPEDDSTTTTIP
ncbi:MAG TPA: hypothetical protein VN634_18045 [Candidatus Limnocylindrales bacterium]|nr:hypothetical protein [Candidatus Limnocylindrales bacterium]